MAGNSGNNVVIPGMPRFIGSAQTSTVGTSNNTLSKNQVKIGGTGVDTEYNSDCGRKPYNQIQQRQSFENQPANVYFSNS